MDIEFWQQMWREGRLGFDQSSVNPYLAEVIDQWLEDGSHHVFVPLCGRSIDMSFIHSAGHSIWGVECVEKAILDFFDSLNLNPQCVSISDSIQCFKAQRYELFCGDFFSMKSQYLERPNSKLKIWDRASLVALPKNLRLKYYQQLIELSGNSLDWMCLLFTYEHPELIGPPFSVEISEIKDIMMPQGYKIEVVTERCIEPQNPKFKEAGVTQFYETLIRVTN